MRAEESILLNRIDGKFHPHGRLSIFAWLNFFKKELINLENDYMIEYMEFYCAKGGQTLA